MRLVVRPRDKLEWGVFMGLLDDMVSMEKGTILGTSFDDRSEWPVDSAYRSVVAYLH